MGCVSLVLVQVWGLADGRKDSKAIRREQGRARGSWRCTLSCRSGNSSDRHGEISLLVSGGQVSSYWVGSICFGGSRHFSLFCCHFFSVGNSRKRTLRRYSLNWGPSDLWSTDRVMEGSKHAAHMLSTGGRRPAWGERHLPRGVFWEWARLGILETAKSGSCKLCSASDILLSLALQ